MANTVVRIDQKSHETLKRLAQKAGKSQSVIVAEAIEELRRKQFFRELHESFAALRNDPKAWKEELAERELWDKTLMDGLEDD